MPALLTTMEVAPDNNVGSFDNNGGSSDNSGAPKMLCSGAPNTTKSNNR